MPSTAVRLGTSSFWNNNQFLSVSSKHYGKFKSLTLLAQKALQGVSYLVLRINCIFLKRRVKIMIQGQVMMQPWTRRGSYYKGLHLIRVRLYAKSSKLFYGRAAAAFRYIRYLKWFRFRFFIRQLLAAAAWKLSIMNRARVESFLTKYFNKPCCVRPQQYRGYSLKAVASKMFYYTKHILMFKTLYKQSCTYNWSVGKYANASFINKCKTILLLTDSVYPSIKLSNLNYVCELIKRVSFRLRSIFVDYFKRKGVLTHSSYFIEFVNGPFPNWRNSGSRFIQLSDRDFYYIIKNIKRRRRKFNWKAFKKFRSRAKRKTKEYLFTRKRRYELKLIEFSKVPILRVEVITKSLNRLKYIFSGLVRLIRHKRTYIKNIRRGLKSVDMKSIILPVSIRNILNYLFSILFTRFFNSLWQLSWYSSGISEFLNNNNSVIQGYYNFNLPIKVSRNFLWKNQKYWLRRRIKTSIFAVKMLVRKNFMMRKLGRLRFGQDFARMMLVLGRMSEKGIVPIHHWLKNMMKFFVMGLGRNLFPRRRRPQKRFIFLMRRSLKFLFLRSNRLVNCKFLVRGKIDGSRRRRRMKWKVGDICLRSFVKPVYYSHSSVQTVMGTLGVRLWGGMRSDKSTGIMEFDSHSTNEREVLNELLRMYYFNKN